MAIVLDGSSGITTPNITSSTPTTGDSSTKLATTEFVNNEISGDVGVANSGLVKTALNAGGSAPIYACRAWVNFNGTGTVAIRASGNVSSITDNGTGDYTVNFATAMPDANYVVVLGGKSSVGDDGFVQIKYNANPTTGTVRLITGGVRNVLSPSDIPYVNVAVFM